jgi:hypothetical protein
MMNRKFLLLVSFLLFLAASARAQNTLVSGTIKDATGQAFSGGTYRFDFYPSPINPSGPYFQNGAPFNVHASVSGNLDSTGSLTNVPVPDNSTITPSGSSWTVTLCPAATSKCFSTIVTITGASQSISSIVPPPIVVSLNNPPPGGVSAYTDAEIVGAKLGSQYFNLTDSTMHVCTSFSGSCTWTQNAAIKPAVSNAIEYVTTTGNDANDGLSWGSAKATIQAAVNALPLTPDGSTAGIVYVAAGTYTFSTGIVLPASHKHDAISIIGIPGEGTTAPNWSVQGGVILNYTGSGAAITQLVTQRANVNDTAGAIRDLVIDGTGSTGSAIGIHFGGMLNMEIRNVGISNFTGAGQAGIVVENVDSSGGQVFTERGHLENVMFENDNIGVDFKSSTSAQSSFGHWSDNTIYFDLYTGQTGIVIGGAGGASVYDGDWTFNGNFTNLTGPATFLSIDGVSNFLGHVNFLCESGGTNTRFSIASGGVIKVFGEFAPTGVFTDSNANPNNGGLVTNGDNNGHYIQFNELSSTAPNVPTCCDINLENQAPIGWRNGANTGDVTLFVNPNNALFYDGNIIATPSGVPWSSVTLSATNTGTGMVLAPTATGTVPFQINAPSGMTVDAFDVNVGTASPIHVLSSGNVNLNNTLFSPTSVNLGGNSLTNAAYLASNAAAPAAGGVLRLGNAEAISWRNAQNLGDEDLNVGASNNLLYDGNTIATPSGVAPQPHLLQTAASQWAGTLALSSGTATFTFPTAYTSTPVCVATDTTAVAAVKAAATTTTLTLTGTGTDAVSFICVGNPN